MKSTTSTLPGAQTRPRSLRPRSTSIRCSARSLGSASSSSASAWSSCGVAPRCRVPAMGWTIARPSSTLTSASGLEPTTSKPSKRKRYMYGDGVGGPQHPVDVQRARRARGLEALRGHDLEGLAGPDALLDVLDGVLEGLRRPRARCTAGVRRAGSAAGTFGTGRDRSRSMASSRATASAYASSTPVSRSLWLIALAISRTVPSQWSSTARSEVSSIVSSGSPGRRRRARRSAPAGARRRSRGSRPCRR